MTMTHKEALRAAVEAGLKVQAEWPKDETQQKIAEAIIRTYLDARGLVMVPREPNENLIAELTHTVRLSAWGRNNIIGRYRSLLSAAPDQFEE